MPKGDKLKLKADPEDGTTPIAHLLLEAVAIANLTGIEKGIIMYLWRQTYGWLVDGQRQIETTLGQDAMAEIFGVSARSIYSSLKNLADKNIILRKDLGSGRGYVYHMNTRISKWDEVCINLKMLKKISNPESKHRSKLLLPYTETSTVEVRPSTETSTLPSTETSTLPSTETSGATLYKEILNQYKETSLSTVPIDEVKIYLTYKLAELMLVNNPKVKLPENLNNWINEIRLLLEKDKKTPLEVLQVIEWSQKDQFWRANILSAGKLREKFDQLYLKMKPTGGTYHGTNAAYKPQPQGTSEPVQALDGDAEAPAGSD
jgi:hypothetical protein